ncbi:MULTISPECIES: hypothetical protein [Pseudanabaena]|nr:MULTISPECIES: hypothetical protein [Pseudanabaena]MEA5489960.1 hypothetical protein [Pseudanabaena sp. CCNP1317]WGS75004.1 hypothetical protein OA858_23705 [Pseudanabaena galeata CCNP1313]
MNVDRLKRHENNMPTIGMNNESKAYSNPKWFESTPQRGALSQPI